jgi:hypothetical protein
MRHFKFRQIAAASALAVTTAIPLAACGGPSVSPRPAQAAGSETSGAPSRAPAATHTEPSGTGNPDPGVARQPVKERPAKTNTVKPDPTKPATPAPTSTKPTGSCFGAVRRDLDLRNTVLDLVKSMCFHTGGILRLQGIGPGLVTAAPGSLVSSSYEGGVVDLRFIRPGTVTVTIPQDEQTYTITVVVVS